ncbi:MAG TPA: alpha/beta hydrolase [Candidatus Dormibacteraeota bacterium]|nr:alpha/beta hydrolase [Candidatus Dormibacteraeota bacterium]
MNPPAGVHSRTVRTSRLNVRYIESGPPDGIPVLMLHGNLSTGRFFEHLMPGAPDRYRIIAPDMRGFGDTERVPIDATRGLRDWADDAHSLMQALGITRPVHLVGWSTGGAAIANYAQDRRVASLTFVDPVSPYGFGGVRLDGTPCFPDYAGSGGGTGNADFTQRIADGDRSSDSPFSPRNVINSSYWNASHKESKEREDMLVDEVLKSVTGDDGYPGDSTPSANWPGIAPGTRGILNALSGKYCNWAGIVAIEPKPPILWTHGGADIVVADGSAWEMGTLGKMGVVPGWPGDEAFPPQPMVTQIRNVLESYRKAGGQVQMETFEGSGHGPLFDAAERWSELFFGFLAKADSKLAEQTA